MSVDTQSELDSVQLLLLEGRINEASDRIKALKGELAAEAAAAAGVPLSVPKTDREILVEFARALVEHLGSPPALTALYDSLAHASSPPAGGAQPQ